MSSGVGGIGVLEAEQAAEEQTPQGAVASPSESTNETPLAGDPVASYRKIVFAVAKGEPEPAPADMMVMLWNCQKTREQYAADVRRYRERIDAAKRLAEAEATQAQIPAAQIVVRQAIENLNAVRARVQPEIDAATAKVREAKDYEHSLSRSSTIAECCQRLTRDFDPAIDRDIQRLQGRIGSLETDLRAVAQDVLPSEETYARAAELRAKVKNDGPMRGEWAKELAAVESDITERETEAQRRRTGIPATIADLRRQVEALEAERLNPDRIRWDD